MLLLLGHKLTLRKESGAGLPLVITVTIHDKKKGPIAAETNCTHEKQ